MKKVIFLLGLIASLVLLYSCSTSKSMKNISYQVLTDSAYQGKQQQSYEVIDNQEDLIKLYRTVKDEEIPEVDFSKSRIVALFMGEKNTGGYAIGDRKSTRLNSSHVKISYAVFCL